MVVLACVGALRPRDVPGLQEGSESDVPLLSTACHVRHRGPLPGLSGHLCSNGSQGPASNGTTCFFGYTEVYCGCVLRCQ